LDGLFFDVSSLKMHLSQSIIAGGVSGVVTRLVVSPLDVVKIRFQLQLEDPRNRSAKYRGMTQAFKQIIHEEGVRGLWKGHLTGQALYIMYGSLQVCLYSLLNWNELESPLFGFRM
jgi:solute carrier family 25 thiamine pyrophosphate transporter 19